jgi:hypothetical protein
VTRPAALPSSYDVAVGGDDALHVAREERHADRVAGHPAHQIHVDDDRRPPGPPLQLLRQLEDVAAQHEDRGMVPGEGEIQVLIGSADGWYDGVRPQRFQNVERPLPGCDFHHGGILASFVPPCQFDAGRVVRE